MARRGKKKRKQGGSEAQEQGAQKPQKVATGLSGLIKSALADAQARHKAEQQALQPASAAPPPSLPSSPKDRPSLFPPSAPLEPLAPVKPREVLRSARDLRLLNEAYEGVTPLSKAARRSMQRAAARMPGRIGAPLPVVPSADDAARQRLNALVGGGVRFTVHVDEDGDAFALREGVPCRELRRLRSSSFHAEATLDLHGERVAQVDREVTRFVRAHHRSGCRYLLIVHGKGLHSSDRCGVLGEAVLQSLTRGGAAPLVRALCHAHPLRGGRGALAIALM